MRGWWQDLTDLVLPAECAGCGTPRTVLCPRCRAALAGGVPRRVRPVPEPPGLPAVYAAAAYADEVRAAVLAHKERGLISLAAPLGAALAGAVRAGLRGTAAGPPGTTGAPGGHRAGPAGGGRTPVLLVPVPSARQAVRARGHDPTRRIALAAAAGLRRGGVAARVLAVLRQRRGVSDQSGLGSRQRRENLTGALTTAPHGAALLRAGPVVLVDDLMTTGTSLAEAARAVTSAVYAARVREEMEAYRTGRSRKEGNPVYRASEMRRAYGAGHVICAAVVAASPDSVVENQELTKNVHRCR